MIATPLTPSDAICDRCGKPLGEHVVQTRPPIWYEGAPGQRVELLGTDFCHERGPDRFTLRDDDRPSHNLD
jgi:hypothetical protein